ncbi:hypothetical protein ACFTQ7_18630 [Lysinibacillus sp. NPDC056959]
MKGIAPDASILAYRVFGDEKGRGYRDNC